MKNLFCLIFFVLSLVESGRVFESRRNPRREFSSTTAKTPSQAPTAKPVTSKYSLNKALLLENLFNVYDPSFLSVVWPKISNGVHLVVEKQCWDDVKVFFKDLAGGRAWAYTAVDASGRYQSSLFEGSTHWLGSKRQCLHLDRLIRERESNSTNEFPNTDYLNAILKKEKYFKDSAEEWQALVKRDELLRRLITADNTPPYKVAYTALQIRLNITKISLVQSHEITLGVCLPRSCTTQDVESIVNFSIILNDNFKSNKTLPRTVKVTNSKLVEEYYDIKDDIGAILLICVSILLVILAIVATIVDLKLIKCMPRNNNSMSFDLQKFNNNLEADHRFEENEHECDLLTRKESNVVDTETLTINNINNTNNINLVTVKKISKVHPTPPSITLDVVSLERVTGSCKRCGKYKKQCNTNPRHSANLPACPRVKSFASLTEKKDTKCAKSILLCFSLSYSWKLIFNTNTTSKDLLIVHFWKVIATFWIIYIHVAMIADYISEDGGNINSYNNAYITMITGTLAFDTIFFVSGLFSAHHFFFLKSQYSVEELVSFGGACGKFLQFVCFVTNRTIRILPSYTYIIFLSSVLARSTSHTSPLSLPERDEVNCELYWWRNVLFITTAFAKEEQCLQMSWVLSAEWQWYLWWSLAAAWGGKRALPLAGAAAAVAAAAELAWSYMAVGDTFYDVYAAYAMFIERPLGRVAPYFIGILAGWLVHKLNGRLNISKTRTWFLWSVSAVGLASTAGLLYAGGWYVAWLHLVWPITLFWPALAFTTNLAGPCRVLFDSSVLAALSRLSVLLLLLHGAVVRTLLLSTTAVSGQSVAIWFYFTGTSLITIFGALLLSLLVETPCYSLLRKLSDYVS